ncbi:MAG: prepilin-type N-terminal cleavage/methylation domain-containing protein [Planctomycetes bacterium]|nr:prepilin-type N-terminal cleavage/methylation domain-containing protein [Planctomycetota bacterium]
MTRRARGFSLMEMVTALMVLGAFALMATSLFNSSMGIATGEGRRAATDGQFEAALAAMRADAWDGYDLRSASPVVALIRISGERTIMWRVHASTHTWTRSVYLGEKTLSEQSWSIGARPIHVETEAGGFIVERTGDELSHTQRWPLVSQVLLLTGAGP